MVVPVTMKLAVNEEAKSQILKFSMKKYSVLCKLLFIMIATSTSVAKITSPIPIPVHTISDKMRSANNQWANNSNETIIEEMEELL